MKYYREISKVLTEERERKNDSNHLHLIRMYQSLTDKEKMEFAIELKELLKTTNYINSSNQYIYSLLQLSAFIKPPFADRFLYNIFLNQILLNRTYNNISLHTLLMNLLCDYGLQENIFDKVKIECKTLENEDYIISAIKRIGVNSPKDSLKLIKYFLDYINKENSNRLTNCLTVVFSKNSIKDFFNFLVNIQRGNLPQISEHPNYSIFEPVIQEVLTKIKQKSTESDLIILSDTLFNNQTVLDANTIFDVCEILISRSEYSQEESIRYMEALYANKANADKIGWLLIPRGQTNHFLKNADNSYQLIGSDDSMISLQIKEHSSIIELLVKSSNSVYPDMHFGQFTNRNYYA